MEWQPIWTWLPQCCLFVKSFLEADSWKAKVKTKEWKRKRSPSVTTLPAFTVTRGYLSQVACHFDVVPGVVIEFSIDRLNDSLKGPRTQINNKRYRPVFQCQVDIIGRFPRVQKEAVSLPGFEGQRDLVAAALDGVLRQVVAEVLRAAEGGHVLLPHCNKEGVIRLGPFFTWGIHFKHWYTAGTVAECQLFARRIYM